jgi:1-deoxy-D-xylulose-5-phosphate reductoisomerase
MSRSITVLGSTGSIGRQTLECVAAQGDFRVSALAAGKNVDLLIEQARAFRPDFVAIADEEAHQKLKDALPGVKTGAGMSAILDAAQMDAEVTMAAIVGTAGLAPTMAAIKRGKTVAFASKECLVAAGPVMMDAVRASGATLLPVDSEHNAIFQVFEQKNRVAIRRIVLTASGGPFRTWSAEQMEKATPQEATQHPTWSMGPKISVDSATMMNKALEVIEAHHLFDMPSEKIDVLLHPQSIVHGMAEYEDGSFLAQMGPSDMRTPISAALAWPERRASPGKRLDLNQLTKMEFSAPDLKRFPALALVRQVLAGSAADAIIFNAANEIAVAEFLAGRIGFTAIVPCIGRMLGACHKPAIKSLEDILDLDDNVRRMTAQTFRQAA